MPSLADIRSQFLGYFAANDHAVIPSAPLVPQSDPSLLFVNAGMVPFKNIFTGAESPPAPRATTSQKCVRAGGKHNDLDNVGYTARHLTFFEMLGNFSFGDYFKEGAIEHAWNLVTGDFGLDPARLSVTVYAEDEDAAALWRKIAGLPEERIIRIGTSDNSGPWGTTAPAVRARRSSTITAPASPAARPARPTRTATVSSRSGTCLHAVRAGGGEIRRDLPRPSIDTGMGLERCATVLQGVHSVFDTDLFRTLIAATESEIGKHAVGEDAGSFRVIADHLRSTSFLIADGVTPSNEGRGYVLRRIMRRAMRHAYLLGATEPLMHRLVPTLTEQMGAAYPDLRRAQPVIEETLRAEEERFHRTLGRGLGLLDEATAGLGAGDTLSGETAFKLYDTYGFPLDLTQDAVRPRGIGVDTAGFDAAMLRQKTLARESGFASGQKAQGTVWLALRDRLGPTRFEGHGQSEVIAETLALVNGEDDVEVARAGDTVSALFDATPFYAEGGGQAGDQGEAEWAGGAGLVRDTRKMAGDLHVHVLEITAGELRAGDRVRLAIDPERRARTRLNHSAAHLVHAALRHVLGAHVSQKGQLVDADRMRFDFSHGGPLTTEQLDAVETEVNAVIRQNLPAQTKEMAPAEAIEAGAMALFGEKYGDSVRVLTLGRALEGDGDYSVELCGGTHVARTGDIALFKITSETGVAAGIRRVEALTGEPARRYLLEQAGVAKALADQFKTPVSEVLGRVETLETQRRKLERDLADAKRQLAVGGSSGGGGVAPEEVGGIKLIARVLQGVGGKELRPIAETYRKQVVDGVVALIGVVDGKAAITVAVVGAAAERVSAVDLAKAAVTALGGQGAGGKPDFAQGGAPDGARAEDGLDWRSSGEGGDGRVRGYGPP